jgi:hypothetical protein
MVVRSPDPLTAPVDDEIVMLSPERGLYFGLNAVGASVWGLLETPRRVSALCGALTAEYDVDDGTCHTEVVGFLEELARAGLIEVNPG